VRTLGGEGGLIRRPIGIGVGMCTGTRGRYSFTINVHCQNFVKSIFLDVQIYGDYARAKPIARPANRRLDKY
jgi:hypothetical protein